MAQYRIITSASPLTITDGIDTFRYYVNGNMYLQQYVSGSWEDIEEYVSSGYSSWRVGVRDEHWVMDGAITSKAFIGAEGTDWENQERHKY